MTAAGAAVRAGLQDRRRRVLAVTCAGSFMGPLDITGVAVALPAMGRDLGLSFSEGLWVSAAYLLAYTLALIPAGRIADQWGRLRVWRVGVLIFTVSSLVVGLSQGAVWLLVARGVQGAGAGMLAATATALVSAVFPPGERGRAIGFNVTAIYLGLSTGPLLGGLLVNGLGWRAVFLVNLPVGVLALLAARSLHEPRPAEGRPRVDVPGTLLLAGGLTMGLVAMTFGPLWGWTAAGTVALLGLGAACLVAFAVVEGRVRTPLLDLALFRRSRLLLAANTAALLNYTAMFGAIALTAILLQVVGGRSATGAGAVLIVQPVMMVALSPFAGRLSDRIGSRWLATGGMLAVASGLGGLALVPDDVPASHLVPALIVVGVGMAAFSSPNTSAAMGAVPPASLGVAAALLATMRSLGQSLSVAILGAIAAGNLGTRGGRVLLDGGGVPADALAYLEGYRSAMAVGAVVALVGAAVSLTRG